LNAPQISGSATGVEKGGIVITSVMRGGVYQLIYLFIYLLVIYSTTLSLAKLHRVKLTDKWAINSKDVEGSEWPK
jgi:hypothetical protein